MAQPVKTVLTPDPVTIDPDLPLSRLLQQLVEMRVKSFPVVDEGRLVGIVSREDVLRALRRATSGQELQQEKQS
jgi:CBS domain-containing protein